MLNVLKVNGFGPSVQMVPLSDVEVWEKIRPISTIPLYM